MKRIVSTVLTVLALSFAASAQNEKLESGIYSVIDGNATLLVYSNEFGNAIF